MVERAAESVEVVVLSQEVPGKCCKLWTELWAKLWWSKVKKDNSMPAGCRNGKVLLISLVLPQDVDLVLQLDAVL